MYFCILMPQCWLFFRLYLELLPIRLHLDQGQLDFLIDFFGKGSLSEECPSPPSDLGGSEISGGSSTFGSQVVVEEALLPFFQVISCAFAITNFVAFLSFSYAN